MMCVWYHIHTSCIMLTVAPCFLLEARVWLQLLELMF